MAHRKEGVTTRCLTLILCCVAALALIGTLGAEPAQAYGETCDLFKACPQGDECRSGLCVRPCNADTECNLSRFDRCLSGFCRKRTCNQDLDCGARKRCNERQDFTTFCTDVECNADADCSGRPCISYDCKDCRQDIDCNTRQCNESTNTCVNCGSNSDCPTLFPHCQAGICNGCLADSQCGEMQICSAPGFGNPRTCANVQCKNDTHCGPGMVCQLHRCAVAQTDLQKVLAELQKLRRLRIQAPPEGRGPITVDTAELDALLDASGGVRTAVGLVVLDKGGRPLLDLGRFTPRAGTTTLDIPASITGQPASDVPRTGDLCGFGVGVTDERGTVRAQTSVCLEVR